MGNSTLELILVLTIIPVFWLIFIEFSKYFLKRKNILLSEKNQLVITLSNCSFSLLGFATGWLIGLSKSPTVSEIMPAIFTFFAGFIAFLFSRKKASSSLGQIMILLLIGAFSLWLILGVEFGIKRKLHDEIIDYKIENSKEETPIITVEKEELNIEELSKELNE